ncbi:MAG: CehA/McbA family metallohydrolase [bacterium]|nr:CehA/McbA family metallohydrolase [bacterium]
MNGARLHRLFRFFLVTIGAWLTAAPGARAHDYSALGVPVIVLDEWSPGDAPEPLVLAQAGRPRGARTRNAQPQLKIIPEYPGVPRVKIIGHIVDAVTSEPLAFRVHIENAEGVYFPPEGHLAIDDPKQNNQGIRFEPDVINRGKNWAFIEDGTFTVELPAMDGYTFEFVRGLEYERPVIKVDLAGKSGPIEGTLPLKRGINMREKMWMSADTHVHNLMPEAAWRQMKGEALDYVNLMFIGAGHPLWKGGLVTGKPAIDKDGYIVYVSQEVRDAQLGHMTLLAMKRPIQPINGYTGKELPEQTYIPHEPLNWEIYDMMHEQGGLAYHAHYTYWPGYGAAVSAALRKLDGVEWLTPDLRYYGNQTRQNIQVPGHPLTGSGTMWYYMLNNGCRLPVIGGTDKMSAGRVVGGGNRTYAHVKTWDHAGFIDALRRGETFVSNGPMLEATANGKPLGSDLKFRGKGPHTVTVKAGVFTQKPITYVEIIQDGQVVDEVAVPPDQKEVAVSKDLTFTKSGWLAVRCGNSERDRNNWENAYTAAHSSPIYVTVDGKLPADKAGAEYMIGRVKVALDWIAKEGFTTEEYRQRAIESTKKALRFYEDALARAEKEAAAGN